MIQATQSDRAAIETFLNHNATVAMFPLSNLAEFGMAGGHPRAMSFWFARSGGEISDVLCISDAGFVFPVCPSMDWEPVVAVLRNCVVKGVLGVADQVVGVKTAARLGEATLDRIEPHYELPLCDLVMPDCAGLALHSLDAVPWEQLIAWRTAYVIETMNVPAVQAPQRAKAEIESYIISDSHRVLLKDGEPVAMTGFNAILPTTVMIGGVYTPPKFRGQGFARAALALHLDEARRNGVTRAVLSAAREEAARAYEAIGFARIGSFAIAIYQDLQVIHG